ncbi:MAG: patatin-like phospholipase family protein [Blastomonas sp.]
MDIRLGQAKIDLEERKVSRDPATPLPLPDTVALVLQGGGALGSYQAGVYEALLKQDIRLDWVAGISIGAINAALIAGNRRSEALDKMRQFWDLVTSGTLNMVLADTHAWLEANHMLGAMTAATLGAPGFFRPHLIPPWFAWPKSDNAISLYDTTPLADTLDKLIDWDRLNDGPVRLSVGAVDIETGNFQYFDTRDAENPTRIDARHIMASGALPPGFPPIEIDGRHYWDGGLLSNTPLSHVVDHQSEDMLVFQVDLFPARGELPEKFADVLSREKDIRYSSRTRAVTDQVLRLRKEHEAIRNVLAMLPEEARDNPDVERVRALLNDNAINIVHLIYKAQKWESGARDFEFSRTTMMHHWSQGRKAVDSVVAKGGLLARNILDGKTAAFDLGGEGRHIRD